MLQFGDRIPHNLIPEKANLLVLAYFEILRIWTINYNIKLANIKNKKLGNRSVSKVYISDCHVL